MARSYKFGDWKSKHLSEFEAYKIMRQIPEEEKLKTKPYEWLRTQQGVIFQHNRKLRTKWKFKIQRLCACLAKKYGEPAIYDSKNNFIRCGGHNYIIADSVKSKEELDYHINKFNLNPTNISVISLTKSKYSLYFQMDNKTIKEFYKHFKFPEWFKPFIKMRHFRTMGVNSRFVFSSRRYNDSSKRSADRKFRNDVLKLQNIGKCYFSLARMLDSKKEAEGKGFPIKDKLYLNLDVDGSCNGIHVITQYGICLKCLKSAQEKLDKVLIKIAASNYPYPKKILFSGTKGFHLHFLVEVTQAYMKEFIEYLNNSEELVDYFKNKEDNFDVHRIMKVPNTIDANTACLIFNDIRRLDVKDKIM